LPHPITLTFIGFPWDGLTSANYKYVETSAEFGDDFLHGVERLAQVFA